MKVSRHAIVALLLAGLASGAFHGIVHNGFIALDDPSYLTDNEQVRQGLSPSGAAWAFTTTHAANWHPLTWLSHMLDVELFGLRPAPHHLVNLALHTANTLLLFLLLRSLTGALWRSAFVCALFAVHPLHVESVAWAAERKDVLATLFTLLAARAWLRAVRTPGTGSLLTTSSLFALGLIAKPMPVTLPFLLLLLDWWPLGRWRHSSDKPGLSLTPKGCAGALCKNLIFLPPARLWLEKLPLFVLAALSSVITLAAQRGTAVASLDLLPLPVRAAHALSAYAEYLGKTLWPVRLSVYYPYYTGSESHTRAGVLLVTLLAFVIVSCFTFRCRQRRPQLLVGWLWYLGTLVPVIGLVQAGSQGLADRYTYLPLTGVFIIAAWTAGEFAGSRAAHRLAIVVTALLLVAGLALRTGNQVALWKSDETLFNHALNIDPDNWMAHNILGRTLAARGDAGGAISHYRQALRFSPWNAFVLGNLGTALIEQGDVPEGIGLLRRALALEPTLAEARAALGRALAARNELEAAVSLYDDAVRLSPRDVEARVNLGNALAAVGRPDAALGHFQEAVRIDPNHSNARYNLGLALALRGDLEGAVANLRETVRLDPAAADGYNNLGLALATQGKLEEAADCYRQAFAINPGQAQAHNNLGVLFATQQRYREAEEQFRKALEIQPGLADARQNLARLTGRDFIASQPHTQPK